MSERIINFNSGKFDEMVGEMSRASLFRMQMKQVVLIVLPIFAVYGALHLLYYGASSLPVFYSGLMLVLGAILVAVLLIWLWKRTKATGRYYGEDIEMTILIFTVGFLGDLWFIQYALNIFAEGATTIEGSLIFWVATIICSIVGIGLILVIITEGIWEFKEMNKYV